MQFSKNQQLAITIDSPVVVVSAAAGSGKTRVLIERILRHLRSGVSLDQLLVVTFTDAAAAEMRERLYQAFIEDSALRSHALHLAYANISTVHSFCQRLLRENFEQAGVDAAFTILGEAAGEKLKTDCMDALFFEEYEKPENAPFLHLVDVYGGRLSDDGLRELVLRTYDFLAADSCVDEQRYAALFDPKNPNMDLWFDAAREELVVAVDAALHSLHLARDICTKTDGPKQYLPQITHDFDVVRRLRQMCDPGSVAPDGSHHEVLYRAFNAISWERMPSIRNAPDPELKSIALSGRTAAKDIITKITRDVFFTTPAKMRDDITRLWPQIDALLGLARRFFDMYSQAKQSRAVLDFLDLERFALDFLKARQTTDQPIRYHEVMVDEYQDTNPMQEEIFNALSSNLFIVGDVCQSIYGFRRSTPELFVRRLLAAHDHSHVRVDLMDNYRSHRDILSIANYLFSRLFCTSLGGVTYAPEHLLKPGREEYPSTADAPRVWLELLETRAEDDTPDTHDQAEATPAVVLETRQIASVIHEICATQTIVCRTTGQPRAAAPHDIVILTRSMKGLAKTVISELFAMGIPAAADRGEGFFSLFEIRTALNFLTVIDNPRQDIPLLGVLTSPLFGVDPDTLIDISNFEIPDLPYSKTGGAFYDRLSLFAVSEHPQAHIAQSFFARLSAWREAAANTPIARFLGQLLYETNFLGLCVGMGADLTARNLQQFEETALEFEAGGGNGLYRFLEYIAWMRPQKGKGGPAQAQPDSTGHVRLITVHASKGLEFPIVICAFLGRRFNLSSDAQSVVFSPTLGVGAKFVDTQRRTRSNTLPCASILHKHRRVALSEELRCMYVALTRACDMLIISAAGRNIAGMADKHRFGTSCPLPLFTRLSATCALDWILAALASDAFVDVLAKEGGFVTKDDVQMRIRVRKDAAFKAYEQLSASSEGDGCASVPETTCPVRPTTHQHQQIPSKLSISEIRRLYDITPHSALYKSPLPTFSHPKFLQPEAELMQSAAERGLAMHAMVQWLDFRTHTGMEDILALHERLLAKNLIGVGVLTEKHFSQLLRLVRSDLGRRIAGANQLWRETPFVLRLPAEKLYPAADGRDSILVHGIIDCHFIDDSGLTLVDFKSGGPTKDVSLKDWAKSHREQIWIYAQALFSAFKQPVRAVVYSFSAGMGEEVEVEAGVDSSLLTLAAQL